MNASFDLPIILLIATDNYCEIILDFMAEMYSCIANFFDIQTIKSKEEGLKVIEANLNICLLIVADTMPNSLLPDASWGNEAGIILINKFKRINPKTPCILFFTQPLNAKIENAYKTRMENNHSKISIFFKDELSCKNNDFRAFLLIEKIKDVLDIKIPEIQSKYSNKSNVNSLIQKNQKILVISALIDEFNAFKKSLNKHWISEKDNDGFPFQKVSCHQYEIYLSRPVEIGETYTATLATRLISELKPKAIFMTGICAGNPDKVKLGDVIVASKIFKVDAGKQTSDGFWHDIATYNLKPQWQHRMQDLAQDTSWHKDIQIPRPKAYIHQKGWLLHNLYDHEAKPDLYPSPADHPDRTLHCPDWQETIKQLVADELIALPDLRLTPAAIDLIRENRILHLDVGFPHDPERPKVHIGAMATTSSVQEDPELFDRIKKYAGQRNILGVEMEGAAIGSVAEITGIPMLVVKAVQDYGDSHKSDQFREYAVEASARFLLKFLETINPDEL